MSAVVDSDAQVTKAGFLDMQVCIPAAWTDEQALAFAEAKNRCGTEGGWHIRRQGSKFLSGCDERVCCHARPGFVHLMLDA